MQRCRRLVCSVERQPLPSQRNQRHDRCSAHPHVAVVCPSFQLRYEFGVLLEQRANERARECVGRCPVGRVVLREPPLPGWQQCRREFAPEAGQHLDGQSLHLEMRVSNQVVGEGERIVHCPVAAVFTRDLLPKLSGQWPVPTFRKARSPAARKYRLASNSPAGRACAFSSRFAAQLSVLVACLDRVCRPEGSRLPCPTCPPARPALLPYPTYPTFRE